MKKLVSNGFYKKYSKKVSWSFHHTLDSDTSDEGGKAKRERLALYIVG